MFVIKLTFIDLDKFGLIKINKTNQYFLTNIFIKPKKPNLITKNVFKHQNVD